MDGGTVTATAKSEEPGVQEHCPIIFFTPEGEEIYEETVKADESDHEDNGDEEGMTEEEKTAEKPAKRLARKACCTLCDQDSVETLRVVGSDSCPKMTGHKHGFARWL